MRSGVPVGGGAVRGKGKYTEEVGRKEFVIRRWQPSGKVLCHLETPLIKCGPSKRYGEMWHW